MDTMMNVMGKASAPNVAIMTSTADVMEPVKTMNSDFVLTADDVEKYRRTGFLLLKGFFSIDMVDYLRARMNEEMKQPTDDYQKGFDKLGYDLCEGDTTIYALIRNKQFQQIMKTLTDKKLFFTQGVGFGLKKNVSTGFTWHIESQSFGFHRTQDYGTTIWIPLHPIDSRGQRGGMRYVPRDIISGEFMYEYIDPAVFRCMEERISQGDVAFADYVDLRDGPLNSYGMRNLLEYYSVEDNFELGDALIFDKFVLHRSVVLEDGPIEKRDAFSLRFIDEDSRYDYRRAHMIEIPRDYYGYKGPTKFHLNICKQDGERIVESAFFDADREKRRLSAD